jgi:hypothetical protein
MNNFPKVKVFKSEKGVSLIITFFIMIIVLSVVLSVSILLCGQLKLLRNIGNSVIAFYAADSGIEKVLYYDWQVKNGDTRGLCSMLDLAKPNYCIEDGSGDSSIYCKAYPDDPKPLVPQGSDCTNCTDCVVKFSTDIGDSIYNTTATVSTDGNFIIDSAGIFGGTQRKIQTLITPTP